jgi:hypothetical protein
MYSFLKLQNIIDELGGMEMYVHSVTHKSLRFLFTHDSILLPEINASSLWKNSTFMHMIAWELMHN